MAGSAVCVRQNTYRAVHFIAWLERRSNRCMLSTSGSSPQSQVRGNVLPQIVAAVPAVSSWATTSALPRAISAEHARRASESQPADRRQLGFRSCKVAVVGLDNIDSAAGAGA